MARYDDRDRSYSHMEPEELLAEVHRQVNPPPLLIELAARLDAGHRENLRLRQQHERDERDLAQCRRRLGELE